MFKLKFQCHSPFCRKNPNPYHFCSLGCHHFNLPTKQSRFNIQQQIQTYQHLRPSHSTNTAFFFACHSINRYDANREPIFPVIKSPIVTPSASAIRNHILVDMRKHRDSTINYGDNIKILSTNHHQLKRERVRRSDISISCIENTTTKRLRIKSERQATKYITCTTYFIQIINVILRRTRHKLRSPTH